MADKYSWLERQRRMVKCKEHGLHYDPKLSSGCTLCAKDAARQIPRRAPQLTLILLCLLGMAVALYQIFGIRAEGIPAFTLGSAESEEATVSFPARLDPEPHREEIENLEVALYRPAIMTTRDLPTAGRHIADAARGLSEAIARRHPGDGTAVAAAITRLTTAADDEFTFADLRSARVLWSRIRASYFHPASWYRSPPSNGLEEQRARLADYRDAASELMGLIGEASGELAALESARAPAPGGGTSDWHQFSSDWRQRLREAWSSLPAGAPSGVDDARVLLAVQQLERAFRRAETAVQASDPAGLDEALELAEKARRGIESR